MQTQTPLLTIIIPFFNNEEFLASTLDSLYCQIEDDVEVIFIDDGSTDNSASVVQQFVNNVSHTNVQFISQENGGIAHARNVGLKHAQGKYLTFLDGDDRLSKGYMKTLRPFMLSGDCDLIDFNYQRFTVEPNVIPESADVAYEVYNFEKYGLSCLEPLFKKSMWHLWNRIYKRTLLDGESFATGRRYEDVIFTPFIYFKTQNIVHLEHTLYFYRDNSQGITRNVKPKDIEDMLFAMKKMLIFAAREPDNQALKNLAAEMMVNCFNEVKSMSKRVYGYYFYEEQTIAILKEAARLCQGTSVRCKKRWQMRFPQTDTLLSSIRLKLKSG